MFFRFLPSRYAGIVFSPQGITDNRLEVSGESSCLFKPVTRFFLLFCQVKPRAKGHNLLGQQLPTLLDDTCCVRFYTLSHVVASAQSLKPVKLLSQQLPTFLLFRDRRSVAQQFWICLRSFSNIVEATHSHYTLSLKSYRSYPSHDALQVPTLLGVVASVSTRLPTRTQQLPTYPATSRWSTRIPLSVPRMENGNDHNDLSNRL